MTAASRVGWFDGRSAVVTGAAHGIGRAVANLLVELGARVVAVDRDEQGLEASFDAGACVRRVGDLAGEDTEQLAADIWQRHGPIQLLVNNVGIETPHRFLELSPADFDIVFDTNLRGPWFFTRRIAQNLIDAELGGSIVFVSSLHDSVIRTLPHYSASKAAAAMLVKELAVELAPHRIRVNAVSPGSIRTERIAGDSTDGETKRRRFIPLGRVGEPDEVARMVAVLLSDEWSSYVTGTNIRVDGGLGLRSWSLEEQAGDLPSWSAKRLARHLRRRG